MGVWAPKMDVIRRDRGVEGRDVRAATLVAEGTTELSIFTSAGSRGATALTALTKRREPYVVLCAVPPGDRIKERGIYVDQLYF